MKKLFLALLILTGSAYAVALTGNALFFYLYISIAAFFALFLFYIFLFKSILSKLDPAIEQLFKNRRKFFYVIAVTCFLFFTNIGSLVERYFHILPIKYAGFLAVFFASAVLGFVILNPHKKKIARTAILAGVSTLLILVLTLSNFYFSSKILTSSQEQLKSLPYLAWVSASDTIQYAGVIKYEKNKTYNEGLNIYCSPDQEVAYLVDMQGNKLHKWSAETDKRKGFAHTQLADNGDLLAIIEEKYIMRLDWASKIKWIKKERAHHDIAVAENGDIYFLIKKDEIIWYHGLPVPAATDYIVICSADGVTKKEIPLYDIFKNELQFSRAKIFSVYYGVLKPRTFLKIIVKMLRGESKMLWLNKVDSLDTFHTNAVSIIDRDIPGFCKKGDLLVSLRHVNLVAVIDFAHGKNIWKWGERDLIMQHHPTLLKNNNILVFDNGSEEKRPYSRVIELDPFVKRIVWEYISSPAEKFFSSTRGSAQRLPNGNTLITNSDSGHVFEVTKSGQIVWEFYNPELNKEKEERVAIYRFLRIVDLQRYPKLADLKSRN